jgi:hypothetical protein
MSVRYHEQLFSRKQREEELQASLDECSSALAVAVELLGLHFFTTITLQFLSDFLIRY